MRQTLHTIILKYWKLVAILCPLIILLVFCSLLVISKNKTQLLMLNWKGNSSTAELLSFNLLNGKTSEIGNATGTIDWFSKAKGIYAVGCADKSKICVHNLIDSSIVEIAIPSSCQNTLSQYGVRSISWSKDGERLLVNCQDDNKSTLCILKVDGSSNCWAERTNDDAIVRADWSPVEDLLAIDTEEQSYILPSIGSRITVIREGNIQIVDLQGNVVKSLGDGWSPSWSPKGDRIAYFRWSEEAGYPGVAIINSNGKNFRWVYLPPVRGTGGDQEYYHPIFRDYNDCIGSSKISWSPDEKSLIIDASVSDFCSSSIFVIDVKTGTITRLGDYHGYIREADIGYAN